MRLFLTTLIAVLGLAAPASAQVAIVDDIVKNNTRCRSPLPAAPPSTATTPRIELRVLVLMDGVPIERAAAALHAARTAYERLGIDLAAAYRTVDLDGTTTEQVMAEALAPYGGKRPSWAHVVHVMSDNALATSPDAPYATTICTGGIRYADEAISVSLTGEAAEAVEDWRLAFPATEGADVTHKLGHLLGGHHVQASCTEPAEREVEPHRVETHACSAMFATPEARAGDFGPVDGAVVRGYAEAFATPIAEPMPVIEPEPEPTPDDEHPPPAGPLDPEHELADALAGSVVDGTVGLAETTVAKAESNLHAVRDEDVPCVEAQTGAIPSTATGPDIELRVAFLLDGVTRARGAEVLEQVGSIYAPRGISVVGSFRDVDFTGPDAPDFIDQAKALLGGERPGWAHVVYVLTSEDIASAGVHGTATLGLADCVGGIAYADRAFAVGEANDFGSADPLDGTSEGGVGSVDPPDADSPVTTGQSTAGTTAAHEIGHLLGARHEEGNCAEGADVRGGDGSTLCTLMFGDATLSAAWFGALDGAVVRGGAEAYARAIAEPMP